MKPLPGLNCGTVRSGTCTLPCLGIFLVTAFLVLGWKVPKFRSVTFSPEATVSWIVSIMVSMMISRSYWVMMSFALSRSLTASLSSL